MSIMTTPGSGTARGVHRWLAPASLVMVAAAALMGWAASFVGLHDYGQHTMAGYTTVTAWFIPGTFDGAAFACTLMTYRASIYGRSALRGRVLMWAFTAVSAWINWTHQPVTETKLVAAGLPVAAVAVFDVVLVELRADYEARHGRTAFRLRPGLLVLRWCVDRAGTSSAFRDQITRIPVEQLAGLAGHAPSAPSSPLPADRSAPTVTPAKSQAGPAQPEPASAPKSRLKLPPPMTAAVTRVAAQAHAEGRAVTVADVHRVINVPDTLAEQIVTEYAAEPTAA